VLLLEVEGNRLAPELIEINRMRYVTLELDVSGADTSETIKDEILRRRDERDLGDAFVRIRFVGRLHPDVELDTELVLAELSEYFAFLDLRDETRPSYDISSIQEEATAKGLFVRKMLGRMERAPDDQKELLESALMLGLQAFDGRELRPR
jgi:hypothetical protein